jgi:hypothetical protein
VLPDESHSKEVSIYTVGDVGITKTSIEGLKPDTTFYIAPPFKEGNLEYDIWFE